MGDSAIRGIPVARAEIRLMFDELKCAPLLHGARGSQPVDLEALTDVVAQVASLAGALGDRLEALEVNPLRVRGSEIEVLDALVRWA
jgi:hypothetical protein